ncbi:MAG: hypothetical protein H0W63_04025 [Gemmatimonadaceae bacterium]|nr:hypothetical protein [Gemmatimonadaceae bacterium]
MTDTVERPETEGERMHREDMVNELVAEIMANENSKPVHAILAREIVRLRLRLVPSEDVKGLVDALKGKARKSVYADVASAKMDGDFGAKEQGAIEESQAEQAILDAFSARDAEIARLKTVINEQVKGFAVTIENLMAEIAALKERTLTPEEAHHFSQPCSFHPCSICTAIRSKLTPTTEGK